MTQNIKFDDNKKQKVKVFSEAINFTKMSYINYHLKGP